MLDYIELNKKNTEILINESTPDKSRKLEKNRYSIQLDMLLPYIDKGEPLLDIGIRDGAFLELLKTRGFTNLYGVDIYERTIEITKSKGISCEVADVHIMKLNRKFSTVVMSHVLEHCPDPAKVLGNVYDHMEEGGVLFIEVPIEYGDPRPTEKDAHYYNFDSIDKLLSFFDNRWEVLEQITVGTRLKIVVKKED